MVLGLFPQSGRPLTRVVSSAVAHFAGLLLGAAAVGALLGLIGLIVLGWLPRGVVLVSLGVAAIVCGLGDIGVIRLPRINSGWQVPRAWTVRWSGPRVYFLFGLMLGAGIFTAAPFASFTGLLLLEFGLGGPVAGLVMAIAYGTSRALATATGMSLSRSGNEFSYIRKTAARARLWRPVLGTSCAFVGALCLCVGATR